MQPETLNASIVDALSASLETMAFICAMPLDPGAPTDCPEHPRRIRIGFTGPTSGTIELLAPRALGAVLASNLLACDSADPEAEANADDVLKELANVTCGRFVASVGGDEIAGYEMGVPQLEPLAPGEWPARIAAEGVTLLDAEGYLIASSVH